MTKHEIFNIKAIDDKIVEIRANIEKLEMIWKEFKEK